MRSLTGSAALRSLRCALLASLPARARSARARWLGARARWRVMLSAVLPDALRSPAGTVHAKQKRMPGASLSLRLPWGWRSVAQTAPLPPGGGLRALARPCRAVASVRGFSCVVRFSAGLHYCLFGLPFVAESARALNLRALLSCSYYICQIKKRNTQKAIVVLAYHCYAVVNTSTPCALRYRA